MRSLRIEQVLLLLLFVVVPLFNLFVRWLRRRALEHQRPAPAEPRAAEPVSREDWLPAPGPPRVRVIDPEHFGEEPRKARPARPPTPVIARRARPLGGPAAVRRAIVAMTILGPCRAREEETPNTAVGSVSSQP